jgi:hypothetical protein
MALAQDKIAGPAGGESERRGKRGIRKEEELLPSRTVQQVRQGQEPRDKRFKQVIEKLLKVEKCHVVHGFGAGSTAYTFSHPSEATKSP